MPFITVSGLKVPVLAGQASRTLEDAGRSSRGMTGQLSKDRRFLRRKLEFKTTPMSYGDYVTLRGLLYRVPVSWRFENNLNSNLQTGVLTSYTSSNVRYSSALASDGTPDLGRVAFGSYALEPAGVTTNIWGSDTATGTDTSATANSFTVIGSATLASDTARAWQGTRSLRMTAAATGAGFRTVQFGANTGASYAASFYITGTATPILCEMYANNTPMGSVTVTPQPTAWQRVRLVAGIVAPINPTDLHIRVTQTTAAATTIYCDGFQLENTSYITPWVNGTRSGITIVGGSSANAVDLFATREGFSVSARIQKMQIAGGTLVQLCNTQGYNGEPYPGLLLAAVTQLGQTVSHTGFTPAMSVTRDDQTSVTVVPAAPLNWGTDDNAFHQVAAVVVPRPTKGVYSMALYFDGVRVGTSTSDLTGLSAQKLHQFYLGSHGSNYPLSAPIDDIAFFPYPLTPTAVAAFYQAGQVSQQWPLHTLGGDALPWGTVQVIGAIEKCEFVSARIGGAVHDNAVQAGLTFLER